MKVLLAIDSSNSSEEAINEVLIRPWPTGTRFCVLHVVDVATPLRHAEAFSTIGRQNEEAETLVRSVSGRLAARGLETATHVERGHAASKIVEYSTEWSADYAIVGSHGRSRVKRFLLGSVAHAVVRHAPCSVMIIRARSDAKPLYTAGMRILLATDGSEYSIAAARSVANRPWPDDSEARVISVVHAVDPMFEPWKGTQEDIDRIEDESLSQGEDDVAAAQRVLANAGLKTFGCVLRGYPKAIIVDEAKSWGADLIVVGSHGRRGIARVLMGTVSEAVAIHAHCSIEVIRESSSSLSLGRSAGSF